MVVYRLRFAFEIDTPDEILIGAHQRRRDFRWRWSDDTNTIENGR